MPGPATPVAPPPNRAPLAGLLGLAAPHPDQGQRAAGWENGFAFAPETCGPGMAVSVVCQLGEGDTKTPAVNADVAEYVPVAVIGSDRCSTLDQGRDRTGRARRHLRSVESHQLERVLWTGEAVGDDTPNGGDRPHLADGNATVLAAGVAVSIAGGLPLLDQALTECLHGQQGMVHVTPLLLAHAAQAEAVMWRDNRWTTPNGHLVVAGSGYTGGGPRPNPGDPLPAAPDLTAHPPAAQWVYGTGMVFTLLGDPVDVLEDVDRETNDQTVRTERPAAALFSPCCQFALRVQPPVYEEIS